MRQEGEQNLELIIIEPTLSPAELVYKYLGSPQLTPNSTLIDIASGFSDFSQFAREQGVISYAIDPYYGHHLNNIATLGEIQVESIVRILQEKYQERLAQSMANVLERFCNSYDLYRDFYLHGYGHALPLPDNFSDLTVSTNGISKFYKDPTYMLNSVYEAIRITKRGGKVILCPWNSSEETEFHFGDYDIHENICTQLERLSGVLTFEFVQGSPILLSSIPLMRQDRIEIIKK